MTNRLTVQFKRLVSTSPAAPGERFVSDPDRQAATDVSGESAVNVKATLSPDDLARACAEAMWKDDDASKASRHGDPANQGRRSCPDNDGQTAHGQRTRHRPWRLHFIAGGFGVRLCLQLP